MKGVTFSVVAFATMLMVSSVAVAQSNCSNQPSPTTTVGKNFRVVWDDPQTGKKGCDAWTSEEAAIAETNTASQNYPVREYWIEKYLGSTLRTQRIELGGGIEWTTDLKIGDRIVYHFPGDPLGKNRRANVKSIDGDFMLTAGRQQLDVSWIIKDHHQQ